MRLPLVLFALHLATPALGNPEWGGLTATGLVFDQTDRVARIEQDLRIGLDRITVDYVFRNLSRADVTGEVIFPLPPVDDLEWLHWQSSEATPAPEALVDFTAKVNGAPVAAKADTTAVVAPPWTEEAPLSDLYDAPGQDVTADLERPGSPLTFDADTVKAALLALSNAEEDEARRLGLVSSVPPEDAGAFPPDTDPRWSLVVRHHWRQTFPAGQDVRLSISYRNLTIGGPLLHWAFAWASPDLIGDAEFVAMFCPGKADVDRLEKTDWSQIGFARISAFVLRTANSWAGPIGHFRLTIDKGDPDTLVMTCADGIVQTGPTTQLWEKRDLYPDRDLLILFLTPFPVGEAGQQPLPRLHRAVPNAASRGSHPVPWPHCRLAQGTAGWSNAPIAQWEVLMRLCLVFIATILATPSLANDGFGGLSATGLTFGQTDAVAMEEEELFIGIDRIAVDYVFRNLTAADVTGEVIFPLPPVPVGQVLESQWNLPEDPDRENLVNFTATVDGQPVSVGIDRVAVVEPEATEMWWPSALQYDTPGRDVTADLGRLGLPLSLNGEKVLAALMALTPEQRAEATELGLAEFYDDGGDYAYAFPRWSVLVRYHWTQTFPAGQTLKISHTYENRAPGGIFGWSHPPEDYMQDVVDMYCIDDSTSKGLAKALARPPLDGEAYSVGMSWNISYILRTANSWAGPIKRFRLTVDKGAPENIVSLCAEGITKTGPTTFVMEKTDYVPERDLHILIATPLQD